MFNLTKCKSTQTHHFVHIFAKKHLRRHFVFRILYNKCVCRYLYPKLLLNLPCATLYSFIEVAIFSRRRQNVRINICNGRTPRQVVKKSSRSHQLLEERCRRQKNQDINRPISSIRSLYISKARAHIDIFPVIPFMKEFSTSLTPHYLNRSETHTKKGDLDRKCTLPVLPNK